MVIAPSRWGNQLLVTNLTGHPCVVVPNGFNRNGSPTSISFMGQLYDEAAILTVTKAAGCKPVLMNNALSLFGELNRRIAPGKIYVNLSQISGIERDW
ncbi:MAG: hypothetical protein R2727_06480 [Bacteroidales bacterium]